MAPKTLKGIEADLEGLEPNRFLQQKFTKTLGFG
jgi:hypothetical protein